jgi:hypothetical protein
MDIDDDDVPSSSNIVVNTPVISLPGARPPGVTSSDMVSSLANKSYSNIGQPIRFNTVTSAQQLPGRQVRCVQVLRSYFEFHTLHYSCFSFGSYF